MSTETTRTDQVRLCAIDELTVGAAALAEVHGQRICVVRTGEREVHAIDDTCSHANVSLSEGEVDGCTVECWLHGSRFDLRTGEPTGLPATRPVAVFPVELDGDDVLISVPCNDSEN